MLAELEEVTIEEVVRAGKFEGICDISNDLYHSSPGLSNSGLKHFAKTPAHYQAYKQESFEPTAPQRIGTLVHGYVLEPDTFESTVISASKVQAEAAREARASGKLLVNKNDIPTARRAADAILNDPYCRALLSNGKAEQSVFWRDPATGVLLKCRPDYLRNDGVIIDLKTYGSDLSDRELMSQTMKMKYHWQSALYLDGVSQLIGKELRYFVHIFVSTDDPVLVRPIILNDAALDKARSEYQELIEKFAECVRTNSWPGYPRPETGVTELSLPDWAW